MAQSAISALSQYILSRSHSGQGPARGRKAEGVTVVTAGSSGVFDRTRETIMLPKVGNWKTASDLSM